MVIQYVGGNREGKGGTNLEGDAHDVPIHIPIVFEEFMQFRR